MTQFGVAQKPMAKTLRVLAHLLRYPSQALYDHFSELEAALVGESALSRQRQQKLSALMRHLQTNDTYASESVYVELFDRGRRTALNLFEHIHGDSRDRGQAMVDLIATYEEAGLVFDANELPDYLPVLLEYASTQPSKAAAEFLAQTSHLVRVIRQALLDIADRRHGPQVEGYAEVLAAVLELAGERVTGERRRGSTVADSDADLDESWAEPPAFAGCSKSGQPADVQPIHWQPPVSGRAAPRGARS